MEKSDFEDRCSLHFNSFQCQIVGLNWIHSGQENWYWPTKIETAKIRLANAAMDTDKVKIYGPRVRVDSMSRIAEIEEAEKKKMREKVQKIIGHRINCFVNRQLIYNFRKELFGDVGILAIEHADFDGIELLGLVIGGEIASTLTIPSLLSLGHCIEEIMFGEDKLIHFSGIEMDEACTIEQIVLPALSSFFQ